MESYLFDYTKPKKVLSLNTEPERVAYSIILNRESSAQECWTIADFLFDYIKLKRFCSIILKVKRFCLMVLSYKNLSCSAEFLSVSVNIRSAKGFEREKMIYIALIVRALFKRFGTKSFFQIWLRKYFREPFSHRFPFFVFAIHYYTLITRYCRR
jgi:hypothetical protein